MLEEAKTCVLCHQLAASRTQVVVGSGDPGAELMLVGEAPSRVDDERGRPFTGAAGELLDDLLAGIGRSRENVYLTTCLMCRPPGNREPLPREVANCRPWLFDKIELVAPKVICTLGSFATRVVRDDPTPVTRLHGQVEIRTIGTRSVRLLPLFHPSAALYTGSLLDALRADFGQLPALLAAAAPDPPAVVPAPDPEDPGEPDGQLGLF